MKLRIERLGHLGDGIAKGPVFVPLALPGEEVEGQLSGNRLEHVRITTPSPDRVRPPCPHYRSCGGCALQHASDAFVERWTAEVVRHALEAQGLEAPIVAVHTSPPASRRRATLAGRRLKKGSVVGFHGRASGAIAEIPDCKLLHPALMGALPMLHELTPLAASRKTEAGFALTLSEAGLDLVVKTARPLDVALRQRLAELAERHDLARLIWGEELIATRRPPVQRLGRAPVVPPPGAFLQATREGEAALVHAVARAVAGHDRIVDLFSGCGTFSLPLAERAEVHAVEGDGAMLAALDAGWRATPGLRRTSHERRDLFRRPLTAEELSAYDAAVLDPPRAGAQAQVAELARSALRTVAMVSCNPVTFARDARVLAEAGFAIEWIEVIDQFRWSPHVELAALLRRG